MSTYNLNGAQKMERDGQPSSLFQYIPDISLCITFDLELYANTSISRQFADNLDLAVLV